jgi:hypothetical protein
LRRDKEHHTWSGGEPFAITLNGFVIERAKKPSRNFLEAGQSGTEQG